MQKKCLVRDKTKYIVVTGGVISGLGKGIFTASLGRLLQAKGLKVVPIKIDPYINADAGTMNPVEHGEVFVLDDGGEVDMDLGNYERFMNLNLTSRSNITTGKIYKKVIDKEREGVYLGKTVQLIPHITDELKDWFKDVARRNKAEIELIEVGGTVGDIENLIFLEALRQLSMEADVIFVHCTLIPILQVVGEQKTKPTQQSVQKLREIGIQPDFVFLRCQVPIQDKIISKIALFTGVCEDNIIRGQDLDNIYKLPAFLEEQNVHKKVMELFDIDDRSTNGLEEWKKMLSRMKSKKEINVAMTGKYMALHDSYVSIEQSLKHAAGMLGCTVKIKWVETTDIEKGKVKAGEALKGIDGVIVPGGFGSRGTEGKIECVRYARENNIPFLGLCYGFQLASIEYARNVCGLAKANSTEIDKNTPHPVIDILPSQKNVYKKGGTMRLGGQDVLIKKGSAAEKLYGFRKVRERFRHRYEFNPEYITRLENKGLVFSGHDSTGEIMQILELPGHKFFMASQFHPEFTSRVLKPNPLFYGFIKSALGK
ncbi:MAG: CTP synthase (glutamine hydrolyzing) [Candidatus Aenigmarchaeota archaeon]|nr:CTP synthase (glutamine hydrolyzing) [Candidatus Aenigmarchaeota archaeon]